MVGPSHLGGLFKSLFYGLRFRVPPVRLGREVFKSKFMNKQEQQEFLSKIPDSNIEWVAQVLLELPAKERHMIVHALRRLDKYLYKSWAKDMTLNEIMEAVNIFSEVKPAAKEQLLNTMNNFDPNAPQANQEVANEQAAEQNAQESASQDKAMEVDSEEGSTEG